MALVIAPESELGKELARWETPKIAGGMKCNGFEPYPKMVYRALPNPRRNGKIVVVEPLPLRSECQSDAEYQVRLSEADAFNKSTYRTAADESEHRRLLSDGWADSPDLALEVHEAKEQEIGVIAAEAAYAATKMSPKAQAERAKREQATDRHLTD